MQKNKIRIGLFFIITLILTSCAAHSSYSNVGGVSEETINEETNGNNTIFETKDGSNDLKLGDSVSNSSKFSEDGIQFITEKASKIDFAIRNYPINTERYTYPDGLYQTGVEMATKKLEASNADGSTVEFLGYEILNKFGVYDPSGKNFFVTITNEYKLIKIIVYDGILNY